MATTSNSRNQLTQAENTTAKVANVMSQEFQNFLSDIETIAKSFTSLTGNELDAAKAQLNQRIAAAKLTIAEVRSNLAQQACNTIAITDNYVHEQPWKAVGAGATIGFLLGFILARRN